MNEKMKILIAYDGLDCSKEAIKDLMRAGLPRETEALVVSVCEAALPSEATTPTSNLVNVPEAKLIAYEIEARAEEARTQALRAVEEAHKLAVAAVQQLKSDFPAWDVRAEAMVGTPAPALIKEADDWCADLIVVGTHGRSALGRLLMGSVSQKVAAEAHCSVRVGRYPAVKKSDSPIRIVVGVDGSLSALAAVREVSLRAWPAGSEALVIAANNYSEPSGIVRMPSAAPKAVLERTAEEETLSPQNMIEIAGEDLRAVAGLHVLSEIREGDPKRVLISEAKTFDADCIFVGFRGSNSRLERHTLGSVSAAVANGAHCSVEVVRSKRIPGVT